MSCDHQFMEENCFDFLEGKLSPEMVGRCEEIIASCHYCAQSCEKARDLYRLSDNWLDSPVPAWHRTRYAVRPPVQDSHWVSWLALASSCFAIVLVVFQFEVSTGNGLTISFGGGQSERRLTETLVSAMDTYRREQGIELSTRLADFAEQQDISNRLLLSEWSQDTREERRDDMNFILTAWESQRFQDQRQLNRRVDTLANSQIESEQFINDLARNVNFQPRGINP